MVKKVVIAIIILAICGGAGIYFSGIDLGAILPTQISNSNESDPIATGSAIDNVDEPETPDEPEEPEKLEEPEEALTKPIEELIDEDDDEDSELTAEKPVEEKPVEKPVVETKPAVESKPETKPQPKPTEESKPTTPAIEPASKPAVEVPVVTTPAIETPVETKPAIETPVETTPAIEAPKEETPIATETAVEIPVATEPAVETPVATEPTPEVPNEAENEEPAPLETVDVPEVTLENPEDPKTLARIKYIITKYKTIPYDDAAYYVALFEKFANERDYLEPEVLMGIARIESGFNPTLSGKYMGMMQVSSYYGQAAGYTEAQLQTAYYNLEYACSILDDLNRRFEGELQYIVLGYNQGYFGLKAKIDRGDELNMYFYNTCMKYADQIRALYE